MTATTRSHAKARALVAQGLDVLVDDTSGDDDFDSSNYDSRDEDAAPIALLLQNATHIVTTAGAYRGEDARGGADPFLSRHGDALRGAARLRAIVYLSSTGVYGEHGGNWVAEDAEARAPPGSTGAARLDAEAEWAAAASVVGARLVVLRLAGIYGPQRSALDTLLRRPGGVGGGRGGEKLTSRVHVRDIVATVAAALESETAAGVYNVSDDEPATRAEVFEHARGLLRAGAAGPACRRQLEYMDGQAADSAARSPSRRDRERASKRVSNGRLRLELLPHLHFPTYRDGLAGIAAAYAAADPESKAK